VVEGNFLPSQSGALLGDRIWSCVVLPELVGKLFRAGRSLPPQPRQVGLSAVGGAI
jgi:hypothetical protein